MTDEPFYKAHWRAIEAGAHAYAANSSRNKNGGYSSLTDWRTNADGDLEGEITLPLAVGIVGGATKVHPTAKIAMKILDVPLHKFYRPIEKPKQSIFCKFLKRELADYENGKLLFCLDL